MDTIVSAVPVLFINPRTKLPDEMPLAMVDAYVPYASYLRLEEAAKVAHIRDEEAALNLIESIFPEENEILSAELPALR